MYTQILTPLDGSEVSEQVLPYVQSLASGLSLPITLLLAVEPEHPSVGQILNPSLHLYETHFHRASHGQAYLERRAAGGRTERNHHGSPQRTVCGHRR
jgi:nucleotide-binding universal stress UspA family protein